MTMDYSPNMFDLDSERTRDHLEEADEARRKPRADIRPGRRYRLQTWVGILGLLAIMTALACGPPDETQVNSFEVGEEPRLQVEGSNGYVTVVSGPAGSIVVNAILRRPDDVSYQVTQTGDTIRIIADEKDSGVLGFGKNPGVDLEITAPSNTTLDLFTRNGRVEVRGIHQSGNVKTSNGRIVAFDVSGQFDLETSNGRIEFDGELIMGGINRMETSNGRIDVKLRGRPSVNLVASTSNGSVKSELPISIESFGDHHIIGKIGNGDAKLQVRTSNGSINVSGGVLDTVQALSDMDLGSIVNSDAGF